MSIFERPQPLIKFDSEGNLSENPDVMTQIAQIKNPLNIVAVVGLYRTGKSYLLNRLAEVKDDVSGFQIGSTIEAQTKGIWVWSKPHPKKEEVLLLMDTEGLGDVEKGNKTQDSRIFVLTTLLCSTLVFNVKNAFDQDTLEKISFVTEMSKHISVSKQTEPVGFKDFDLFFPVFVLVIRDFGLELKADGKDITADEYLDKICLNTTSKKDSSYNEPRKCLRKYFITRKCFTFVSPAHSKHLKMLNKLSDDKLDEEFREQSDSFKKYVLEECPQKKLNDGHSVNGPIFVSLVQSYVASIKSGKLPCIEDALNTVASIENTKAVDKCVETYTTKMAASVSYPTDTLQQLSDAHHDSVKVAIDEFLKTAVYDKDQAFLKKANELMDKKYKALVEENETISVKKSSEALMQLSASLEKKTKEGQFAKPGGYKLFKTDLDEVEAKYKQLTGLGIKKEVVLFDYLKKKQEEASQIMDMDSKMTQYERDAEGRSQRASLSERATRLEKCRLEDKYHLDEDEKLQMEENIHLYQMHFKDYLAEMLKSNQAALTHRLKEFEDTRKIESLQSEINKMKEEQKEEQKKSGCHIM